MIKTTIYLYLSYKPIFKTYCNDFLTMLFIVGSARDAIYRGNGLIALTRSENIKAGFFLDKTISYITMLPEENVKLHSNYDYWLAEQLIQIINCKGLN